MEPKNIKLLNNLSFISLLLTIFGLIVFFIPYLAIPIFISKGFLLSIGATTSLFFWFVASLGEGKIKIPSDRIVLYASFIPAVFLLSSLFSSSLHVSIYGNGFDLGTFGSMLVLFIVFFLSSIHFQIEKNLKYFFVSLLTGALCVVLFQLCYLFVDVSHFSPAFTQGTLGNLVGTWDDFALFLGLIVLLSMLTMDFIKTRGLILLLQYLLVISSLFFIIITNISMVWLLLGIFSVIIFTYIISTQHLNSNTIISSTTTKKFPFLVLSIVLLSFIFIVNGNVIQGFISKYVNFSDSQVRPSVGATLQIAGKALKHNFLLGTGPNTFDVDWELWSPKNIAQTSFWGTEFHNGVGVLPTFLVTTGLMGLLSILLFLTVLFTRGLQSFKIAQRDMISNYFIVSTLLVCAYTWIALICYTPNILIVTLSFVSSGILVGFLVNRGLINVKEINFFKEFNRKFLAVFLIVLFLLANAFYAYVYIEKFISICLFSQISISDKSMNSLLKSEKLLNSAISLDGNNDLYHRVLSQIYLSQMNIIISDKNMAPELLKSNLQNLINAAQKEALLAVEKNPKKYLNQLNLATIYSVFASLGVEHSYESAVVAYNHAVLLSPNNPSIPLAQARLEFTKNDHSQARFFIKKSLDIKSNYVDAILYLAQISASEGDLSSATKQAEYAASQAPNDYSVFFMLGFYRYSSGDYVGAISSLENSVLLNPNYINTHYLLGQAYQKVGRTQDALNQYNILLKIIPDNQDVKDAIDSLSNTKTSVAPVSKLIPSKKSVKIKP